MLTKEDLKVGSTYRGKRYKECLGFSNDRHILWMSDTEVQYNSDTVKIGWHYPKIDIEKFLRWAKEKVSTAGNKKEEKMLYIESPEVYRGQRKSLFLAGGITGCPDWQEQMKERLKDVDVVLLNPRRKNFPINDPTAAKAQIKWEHEHLRKASAILIWFPWETLCPIVLYELGAWSMTRKRLFVGVHPDYERKRDVKIQTRLARPDVEIVYNLGSLADQVKKAFNA